MSELTKGQLRSGNNSSFPNNNTQAITPTILRDFNGDIIDSLVDEIGYNIDSGSWNQKIAAAGISGSLLTTASFSEATRNMTFTKADGTTFTTNIADGAAVATGSFLETASLANNGLFDMTFTKADGSTFVVNIPLAAATGSLLKDASNNDNATTTYTRGSGTTFTTTINNVNNAVSSSVSAVADSVPFSFEEVSSASALIFNSPPLNSQFPKATTYISNDGHASHLPKLTLKPILLGSRC